MKFFLRQVRSQWIHTKRSSYNQYTKRSLKLILRRILILANREMSLIIFQLVTVPTSLIILLISILFSLYVSTTVPRADVIDFLATTSQFIISFISTLVAAAIFISTLHRQSNDGSAKLRTKFANTIWNNKDTIRKVFDRCEDIATAEEKSLLFRAAACDSILRTDDYSSYKEWHLRQRGFVNEQAMMNDYIWYPYDTAKYAIQGRRYCLITACEIAIPLLDKRGNAVTDQELRKSVKSLLAAAREYEGESYNYIPLEFVGRRLYRVVIYSLISLGLILVVNILKSYSYDVFPHININISEKVSIAALIMTILAIYLILRYIFKFIVYLGTRSYQWDRLNVPVFDDDAEMHKPAPGALQL